MSKSEAEGLTLIPSKSAHAEEAEEKPREAEERVPRDWFRLIREKDLNGIQATIRDSVADIVSRHQSVLDGFAAVALMESGGSISTFSTDRVFRALSEINPEQNKDVLLVLLSPGGAIEPAYQISKVCKQYAKKRLVVLVPRQAKSAATLIALGADEIHLGTLGQLGPIDPQLGGLPALGVVQALRSIAYMAQEFPGSSEMFARYLRMALTVEQIGYCERIGESAVQYAERLLAAKESLPEEASTIARRLVYEYKDHGFVIDPEEAQALLGSDWVRTKSEESQFAEELYTLYEDIDLALRVAKQSRLLILGDLRSDHFIFTLDNR